MYDVLLYFQFKNTLLQ